jgi:hypothetical protein
MLLDYDGWDGWEMFNEYEVPSYEEDNNNNTNNTTNKLHISDYISVGLAVIRTSRNQFNKWRKSLIEHLMCMKNFKWIQWAC